MDISKYKFYIRDVGISNDDLNNVLQNVINDIALTTRIFKKAFGFEVLPNVKEYDFRVLLEISERLQENNINSIVIGEYTENQLVDFLLDPTNLDVNVEVERTIGIPYNTYIEVIDVLNNNLNSIFRDFEYLFDSKYVYKYENKEPIQAICLVSVIPNIENIDEKIETIIRPTIIEGLKYYTDTSLNPQNVNPTVSSYKKYVNAKIELQNKFPVNISKQFKRSFL